MKSQHRTGQGSLGTSAKNRVVVGGLSGVGSILAECEEHDAQSLLLPLSSDSPHPSKQPRHETAVEVYSWEEQSSPTPISCNSPGRFPWGAVPHHMVLSLF